MSPWLEHFFGLANLLTDFVSVGVHKETSTLPCEVNNKHFYLIEVAVKLSGILLRETFKESDSAVVAGLCQSFHAPLMNNFCLQ